MVAKALKELNAAIENGAEFPDVAGMIARKHRLAYETLCDAYDRQFAY